MVKNKKSSSNILKDKKKKGSNKLGAEKQSIRKHDSELKNEKKVSVTKIQDDKHSIKNVQITSSLNNPSKHQILPYSASKVSFHPDAINDHKNDVAQIYSSLNEISQLSKFNSLDDTNEGEKVSIFNSDDYKENKDISSPALKSRDSLVKKKSSNPIVVGVKSILSKFKFKRRKKEQHNKAQTNTGSNFKPSYIDNALNVFSFPESFHRYSSLNQDYNGFTRDTFSSERDGLYARPHTKDHVFANFRLLPHRTYTPEDLRNLQIFCENLMRFSEDLSEAEKIVRCREHSLFAHIEKMVDIASKNFVEDLCRLDKSLESALLDTRLHQK